MRLTSSLSPDLPGLMAMVPERVGLVARSRWSRRSPAFLSAGPWQLKQLFARIGRMSRLKSIAASLLDGGPVGSPWARVTHTRGKTSKARLRRFTIEVPLRR